MAKQIPIKQRGSIEEVLPNAQFRVKTEGGLLVLCSISGKMKKNYIKIYIGDDVDIELSPYDLSRGRITYRHKRLDNSRENL